MEWNYTRWQTEILCGFSVALAQVSEATAFAFVAGVEPYVGLTAGWIVGLITALFGGRPAMICGATGAIAAVQTSMVSEDGVETLFYAVMLMGVLQMIAGVVNAGELLKMVSHPVMLGFCNGLGGIIGLAQFGAFKELLTTAQEAQYDSASHGYFGTHNFDVLLNDKPWVGGGQLWWGIAICAQAFLIAFLLPMLTNKIPSSLIALLWVTFFEHVILRIALDDDGTYTVGDKNPVGGDMPLPVWSDSQYTMPTIDGELIGKIFPLAFIMAIIGLLESLMTLQKIDEMTHTRGNTNRECIGQGLAKLVAAAFGGMGGCATIGQSMINVESGGRTRISAVAAALSLLLFIVAANQAIDHIPLAGLAGVMFNIVVSTVEWGSFRLMLLAILPGCLRDKCSCIGVLKVKRSDVFTVVLVTVVTLFSDLAIAVIIGMVFQSIMHAWEMGSRGLSVTRTDSTDDNGKPVKVYIIKGSLFFASVSAFLEFFDLESDPDTIKIYFHCGTLSDYSALVALNTVANRYGALEKKVVVCNLQPLDWHTVQKATDFSEALSFEQATISSDWKLPPNEVTRGRQQGLNMLARNKGNNLVARNNPVAKPEPIDQSEWL